jgi:hypothetical protein
MTPDVSGFGFVFWALVLALWCFEGRRFLRAHAFEGGMIAFYLATYYLIEVSARIFESAIPVVLLAALNMTGWRRSGFLTLFVLLFAAQWAMRIGEPLLGFAAN